MLGQSVSSDYLILGQGVSSDCLILGQGVSSDYLVMIIALTHLVLDHGNSSDLPCIRPW